MFLMTKGKFQVDVTIYLFHCSMIGYNGNKVRGEGSNNIEQGGGKEGSETGPKRKTEVEGVMGT